MKDHLTPPPPSKNSSDFGHITGCPYSCLLKSSFQYRDFGVDLSRHARTDTRTHGRVHARIYARTLIHHTVNISGLTACSYVHMRAICVCATLCIVTAMRYGAALELLRVAVPT